MHTLSTLGLLLSGPLALFMLVLLWAAIAEWVLESGNHKVAGCWVGLDSPICVKVSLGECRTSLSIIPSFEGGVVKLPLGERDML